MLVASIALQAYSAWMLRSSITMKDLRPYVVAGLATVPLGFSPVAHTHVASLFGTWTFLCLCGSYMLLRPLGFWPQTMSPGKSL